MSFPKLPKPDQVHLDAARGWLGLRNVAEATLEIEDITPQLKAHPEVLRVRYGIYEAAGQWEAAADIAYAVSELVPDDSWGIRHHADALHKQNLTSDAWDVLFPMLDRFAEWQVCYDLARYGARIGKLTEAFTLLSKAFELNNGADLRRRALEEPDLQPLWVNIGQFKGRG